ncbi:MAG: hypothetical protein ACLUI5_11645 [Fusicatenibacter saccharivorans]
MRAVFAENRIVIYDVMCCSVSEIKPKENGAALQHGQNRMTTGSDR